MKKNLLLLGMLFLSSLAFAQTSKQQAINLVMDSIAKRDTININVYVEPLLQTDSYYKMSRYDSIQSPYANYWLFFIDDMPEYGWGHDCRYVFLNSESGALFIRNSQIPPWRFKDKFETVSEPIGHNTSSTNSQNQYYSELVTDPVEGKYAVLFSGGEESGNGDTCFWNALSHSYCGLIENGYKKENIFVLSCNGDTFDSLGQPTNLYLDLNQDGTDDILRKICNVENLQSVFDTLAIIMEEGDLLYVYGTMHGYHDTINPNSYWLSLWEQERLYDTVFSSMISQINCSQYIVNIWSCLSGGIAEKIIAIPNDIHKTVLSCTSSFLPAFRPDTINNYLNMDGYNYFINTAFRYYHPNSRNNQPWIRDTIIGNLQDPFLFSILQMADTIDINFDKSENYGNGNGIQEINEIIKYTKKYNIQFDLTGVKHYDCGFKDDLLSLHGITGKVVTIDTVSGNFHIEDTLSVCAQTLRMEDFAKFYLFDADLIIEDTASLVMGDTTAIIARSGNCRIIIKGSLTLGNGVTFEARDGATLEIIYENDANLAISNATFINCKLDLPSQNLSFDYCHFDGTPLEMNNTSDQSSTAIVTNCVFKPNGSNISNAVYIKNFAHYKVSGCTIDSIGGGAFKNGIAVYNSGSNSGLKQISGNDVSGCLQAGIQMYASSGSITMNAVYGNGYGIKLLNNCNITSLSGNCGATTESGTQFIHDNTNNEVYMTGSSVPQRFRYNAIHHNGNMAFVYHDAYIAFGGEGELPVRGSIDVKYNHWGSGFVPTMHLYTNLIGGAYEYYPEWVMGDCHDDWVDAAMLLNEADSLNDAGAYSGARFVYKQVVEDYPETVSAETALKSLLLLEAQLEGDYLSLKEYYLSNRAIAVDETLAHLASSLANKCDVILGNYSEAIVWYENVLTDSTTNFNDSIFAAIDLGDLYLKMEAGGEKAIGKLEKYRPKSAIEHEFQTDRALSLLPRKTSIEQGLTELSPIQDLNLSVGNNDTILLTWNLPSDSNLEPMTLSWLMSDTINDHVQAGYDSYMGNLYDTLDLRNFIGWKIETVSFYKCSNWTHVVYVFEQKRGEEMSVLYNQEISDEMPFGLNTIQLEEDLFIEPNTLYWFALRITHHQGQQGYTYPFGVVWGEQGVEGKSNLCLMPGSNSWFEMPLPNAHYWIRACLVNFENTQCDKDDLSLTGYRVYRDGALIKEIPYSFVTYYTDTEFTRGFGVEYCVTAVYGDEESEPVCTTVNITGVGEKPENDNVITLSPNPTNGIVYIEGMIASEIRVYNALGQLVKAFNDTNEIDLKDLTQGVYLLRITDGNGAIVTKKIVVE